MRRTRAASVLVSCTLFGVVVAPTTAATATYPGDVGRLAFGVRQAGPGIGFFPDFDIHSVHPDGSGLTALTSGPAFDACPAWTADGSTIYYCSNATGTFEIWRMAADGSAQEQVTDRGGHSIFPDPSPDGGRIAYATAESGDERSQVVIRDLASGDEQVVVPVGAPAGAAYELPAWSPDGRELAMLEWDGRLGRLVVVNVESLQRRVLWQNARLDQTPDWSPDGSRLAFVSAMQLWTVSADGSDRRLVVSNSGGQQFGAAWSPDGERIAFLRSTQHTSRHVHTVRPDGSDLRRVVETPGAHAVPGWGPAPQR